MGFGFWDLGCGFGVGVWGLGLWVPGLGSRVQCSGFGIWDLLFRVEGPEFRVYGVGVGF